MPANYRVRAGVIALLLCATVYVGAGQGQVVYAAPLKQSFAALTGALNGVSVSLTAREGKFTTMARVRFESWSMLLWKQVFPAAYPHVFTVGGSVMFPFIRVGSLRPTGDFTVFADTSSRRAWSAYAYKPAQWLPRGASSTVPMMAILSYITPVFASLASVRTDAWMGISDIYKPHPLRHAGTALSATLRGGILYKVRMLYQHTTRDVLHFSSAQKKSWYLTFPTARELHGAALSQVFQFPFVFARVIAKMSAADSTSVRGGGSALIRADIGLFSLAVGGQGTQARAVTELFTYPKYLWSQSAEASWRYGSASLIRGRYGIYYINPAVNINAIRGNSDTVIYQHYSLLWRHRWTAGLQARGNTKKTAAHIISLGYDFWNETTRHKTDVSYRIVFKDLRIENSIVMDYYYRDEASPRETPLSVSVFDYPLTSLNMQLKMYISKSDFIPGLRVFYRFNLTLRPYKRDRKHGDTVFKRLKITGGMSTRVGPLFLGLSIPYTFVYSHEGINVSAAVEFSMRYTKK